MPTIRKAARDLEPGDRLHIRTGAGDRDHGVFDVLAVEHLTNGVVRVVLPAAQGEVAHYSPDDEVTVEDRTTEGRGNTFRLLHLLDGSTAEGHWLFGSIGGGVYGFVSPDTGTLIPLTAVTVADRATGQDVDRAMTDAAALGAIRDVFADIDKRAGPTLTVDDYRDALTRVRGILDSSGN